MYTPRDMKNVNSTVSGETFRLRLTQDMKLWLFQRAHDTNRTVSDLIREAITDYMRK